VEQAFFVSTQARVEGHPGELVSLIPWGGKVTGVTTAGLRWPLKDDTLYPYKTRGISNELLGQTASVSLESGLLLVVHSHSRQSKTA
jgi:thiamine pyrophosphokinase